MTKLSTHLPQEVVQSNKKLQEIECETYWNPYYEEDNGIEKRQGYIVCRYRCYKSYPAPTIADIIDNAEMLFGDDFNFGRLSGAVILKMCQQDKSTEEVSKYIIDNIK